MINEKVWLRKLFAEHILHLMESNQKIHIVCGDLGYRMWDNVRLKYPLRFINTGAAEQTMVGIAVGLALANKIPIVYSITPFLLYRPFETIRNYLNHEQIPVKLIGGGRNKDYLNDGFSHYSEEDKSVMKLFPNIKSFWPNTPDELISITDRMLKDQKPYYINLPR